MPTPDRPDNAAADRDRDVMDRHGITLVRADHYHVGGYRYTKLADAVAQARRQASTSGRGD